MYLGLVWDTCKIHVKYQDTCILLECKRAFKIHLRYIKIHPRYMYSTGLVLFFPESGVDFSHTHSCAFYCILMHFQHFHCISSDCIFHMLHFNASSCILTHSCKLHSGMMHSLAFIRIFNVAFGTKCIHVHFYASYVGCILIACCIHVHPMHKMHSCAFLVCCILYMSHCNAF